jgi:hypothetical protein
MTVGARGWKTDGGAPSASAGAHRRAVVSLPVNAVVAVPGATAAQPMMGPHPQPNISSAETPSANRGLFLHDLMPTGSCNTVTS